MVVTVTDVVSVLQAGVIVTGVVTRALGRLLAAAEGYWIVSSDGTHLGWLDHVRYERHVDHPDEIVVRRRSLLVAAPCASLQRG